MSEGSMLVCLSIYSFRSVRNLFSDNMTSLLRTPTMFGSIWGEG